MRAFNASYADRPSQSEIVEKKWIAVSVLGALDLFPSTVRDLRLICPDRQNDED